MNRNLKYGFSSFRSSRKRDSTHAAEFRSSEVLRFKLIFFGALNLIHRSIMQLSALKTQHEEELKDLQRQLDSLSDARNRFLNARNTTCRPGNTIYIPCVLSC